MEEGSYGGEKEREEAGEGGPVAVTVGRDRKSVV